MYDVIIAGAGPAGSTCAQSCAQHGLKTLLLDRAVFPRSKPCGGAVSIQALLLLDFTVPKKVIEKECFAARVHFNGSSVFIKKEQRIAVLVRRDLFDAFLADKAVEAGALFHPGEGFIDVRQTGNLAEVVTGKATHQTRFLIGADGVHSRVAFALRPPFQKEETALALVSHVIAAPETRDQQQDTIIDLHFGIAPLGYGWQIPHHGYCSLGVAGSAHRLSDPQKVLSEFAHSCGMDLSAVRGHFIPLGGRRRVVASRNILLAGDAAGFADPLHGEGIAYAILSGKLAAQAVINAIRSGKDPSSAASWYQHETDRQIVKELRVAYGMAKLLDNHPRLFLRIFFDHPKALQRYLDIPAGKTTYQHFIWWILPRIPYLLLLPRRHETGYPASHDVRS
jgi:geranylgeranyl reductase family protein